MKKILNIILIVLFPLGMLFCIGKCLFTRDIFAFMGGIFLLLGGFITSICLFSPQIITSILPFLA